MNLRMIELPWDDLDIEVESFTGYGNEPEYTEQEISK